MDFDLTEDHMMVRDMAREFSQGVVAPGAAERDREGRFPIDEFRRSGELGFTGVARGVPANHPRYAKAAV